jgi:hypothetical protein
LEVVRMGGKKRAGAELIDWHRAATDVAYFADRLLGIKLEPWQIEVLECGALTVVAACGRGAGK